MKKMTIDRFDGIYAICEDKDRNFFEIELGELPQGAKAGEKRRAVKSACRKSRRSSSAFKAACTQKKRGFAKWDV